MSLPYGMDDRVNSASVSVELPLTSRIISFSKITNMLENDVYPKYLQAEIRLSSYICLIININQMA